MEMLLVFIVIVVQLLSHVQLFVTPWTVACQAPLSMGFSRQGYWSRLPFPSPGDLPDLGIKPLSLGSPALASRFFTVESAGLPLLVFIYSLQSFYYFFNQLQLVQFFTRLQILALLLVTNSDSLWPKQGLSKAVISVQTVRELFATFGIRKYDQNINLFTFYFIKKSFLSDMAD